MAKAVAPPNGMTVELLTIILSNPKRPQMPGELTINDCAIIAGLSPDVIKNHVYGRSLPLLQATTDENSFFGRLNSKVTINVRIFWDWLLELNGIKLEDDTGEWLTIQQAQHYLGRPGLAFMHLLLGQTNTAPPPSTKTGGRTRFKREDLRTWYADLLRSRKAKPADN